MHPSLHSYLHPLISIIDFKINFRKCPFVSKIWAHNLPDEPEALKKKQSRKVPWFVVCMYVDMHAPKVSKSTLLKKFKIPLTTTLNHFRVFVSWSFCHPKWFGHHLSASDGPTSALIPTKKKEMEDFSYPLDAWKIFYFWCLGDSKKFVENGLKRTVTSIHSGCRQCHIIWLAKCLSTKTIARNIVCLNSSFANEKWKETLQKVFTRPSLLSAWNPEESLSTDAIRKKAQDWLSWPIHGYFLG